jgi:hypothetical protein
MKFQHVMDIERFLKILPARELMTDSREAISVECHCEHLPPSDAAEKFVHTGPRDGGRGRPAWKPNQ